MSAFGVAAKLGLDQDSRTKDAVLLNSINASYARTQDADPSSLLGNGSSSLLLEPHQKSKDDAESRENVAKDSTMGEGEQCSLW
ncbi:hypothetical protein N7534_005602 [Penicillium rubens]|nr:hypothetical protein N7534_005602 [Penicillium rubens]